MIFINCIILVISFYFCSNIYLSASIHTRQALALFFTQQLNYIGLFRWYVSFNQTTKFSLKSEVNVFYWNFNRLRFLFHIYICKVLVEDSYRSVCLYKQYNYDDHNSFYTSGHLNFFYIHYNLIPSFDTLILIISLG